MLICYPSEIATMISGRYVQIEMLPLSFREYMESTGSMNDRGIKYGAPVRCS